MRDEPLLTGDRNEVLRAIRHVRNRWRLRLALRGVAVLVAAALGTLLASSFGLELFRFDPAAIIGFRVVTYVALLAFGWWLFIRPVSRRVSDERVALYIEEHAPELQATVLSAVEESRKGARERGRGSLSRARTSAHRVGGCARIPRDIDMGRRVGNGPTPPLDGDVGDGRPRRAAALHLRAGLSAARHQRAAHPDGERAGGQPVQHRGSAGGTRPSRAVPIRRSRPGSSGSRRKTSTCSCGARPATRSTGCR